MNNKTIIQAIAFLGYVLLFVALSIFISLWNLYIGLAFIGLGLGKFFGAYADKMEE